MIIAQPALPQIYLNPGELLVSREAATVVTVLGSCVAITFFNARLHLSAICHAMLPRPRHGETQTRPGKERFKYLSEAVPHMVEEFRRAGIPPAETTVKLFGGANVIGGRSTDSQEHWVGTNNVQAARELLEAAGFAITAANVGGTRGRKLLFNTATGEVRHKHLAR